MNYLQKIYALLSKEGRTVKYGVMTDETAPLLVTIAADEDAESTPCLGENGFSRIACVLVSVYAADYLEGWTLSQTLDEELKSAVKDTVFLTYDKALGSDYDESKARYVFKTRYKIIL